MGNSPALWSSGSWAISASCVTMGRPTQWTPALWEQKYLAGLVGSTVRSRGYSKGSTDSLLDD